jgi:hypothetical protein
MIESAFLSLALFLQANSAAVEAPRPVGDPRPQPTVSWFVMQAVPSPGVGIGQDGAHLSLAWQVTPILLSWGLDPRLNFLRFFIVEPSYRTSGSIELFVSPEYLGRGPAVERWGASGGARATIPLIARGENLSLSLGSGAHVFSGATGVFFEGGVHTLFGMTGLTVKVAPFFERNFVQINFRVRWF